MASSSAPRGRSSSFDVRRPDMSDLRIVLIGKNKSENSRVENTILDTTAFQSAASLHSQHLSLRICAGVEQRHITVIETSHLLDPHLQQHQISQTVRECVSQSAPGPYAIILILQFNDFTEADRQRVKYVLSLFSNQAINHTIVLTTDEETRGFIFASRNDAVHNLIKECGGGHVKFDTTTGWRSDFFRRIEEMLKEEKEEFLSCDLYRGESSSGKAKCLNLVLCGNNTTLKKTVSKLIRGKSNKPTNPLQKVESKECVKKKAKIDRHEINEISVIELPVLTCLSEEEVMRQIHHCLCLCDPGVHLFIFVTPVTPLTNEDEAEMEKINRTFNSKDHFMVLFITDRTVDHSVSDFVSSTESQRIVNLYGSCFSVIGLMDHRNSEQILKILNAVDQLNTESYSLQKFLRVHESRIRDDLEEKLSAKEKETKELQEKIKTLESVKLNLVLCGSNIELKSFISSLFVNQTERGWTELSSECVRTEVELNGRLINLVELPDLSRLSEEEVMRQTLRCVSLCHPGVHLFLLIIPDTPLNDQEKAEMKEIQRIFSSNINKHMMILIKQSSEDNKKLSEETQAVIESFGGQHHFIEQKTEVSTLMEEIWKTVEENRGEVFTIETFLEPHMKYEKMKRRNYSLEMRFQSQESRERENELRIVLLGKTGVGKSSTGNTILGREVFYSDTSENLVTKVCQKDTVEMNRRHITVIDTPGLFDTELTNEEIKNEIRHCISMSLPGPHVFIIVLSLGQRFTQEEQEAVKIIQENFGENSLMYTIVLFTRGDELRNKTIEHFLGKPGSHLNQLIETCGNRVHVFNNKKTEDRTQVSDLLQKIDHMVKTNGESFYSCRMFREMERGIQEQREKMMMEKVEQLRREKEELNKHKEETERMMREERQNHEEDKKRRVEEFREREERYKRDIIEKEQEIKIQEKLKKEREEWEKQRQQERKIREEEEEIRRKKEQEISDEYNQRLKEEKERMKMRTEKGILKHEKERKRREEEFREKEERYKAEMKSEREEWEKQKLEAQQRRQEEENKRKKIEQEMWDEYNHRLKHDIERLKIIIEEDRENQEKERKKRAEEHERRRKIEQETWDEYYQILKRERERRLREKEDFQFKYEEEKERMKKMMEEQRQNLYKKRKRMVEENIEREEEFKRDIKEIDERERKIQEELKREREEWNRKKEQERQREEEEKERNTSSGNNLSGQLYQGTCEVQPNNDDNLPSDPGCLRILLFGRTGLGKSATGNSIVCKNEFLSEASTDSVTKTCQKGVGEVSGKSVAVVDTPDIFDTTLTNEQVVEEILKCISLSAPGPHVFLIVLSVGRITQEEKDILDVIKIIFGQRAAEFSIVLFTREDELKKQTIEQYVERSKNNELKKLVSDCGNRFLAFNNKKTEDRIQVSQLLNMIEEVKKNNQGRYFSNETFKEAAISVEERMKTLEENERINQAHVEELEVRYEREVRLMIERLQENRQKKEQERVKLEKKFREREETLKREFKEKEKSEQKKREKEDQKRSELEKQLRDEYEEKLEKMKREMEDQRSGLKKRQKERKDEERKREEKYNEDQEKMKNQHGQIIAELQVKLNNETKKRDLEEEMRKEQEEKEREEWRRKIEEAESGKKEMIEQLREWEEEKKREMKEREEEERKRKERHTKQLREKEKELEKMRKKFEREKDEERQMMEEEKQKQRNERELREREYGEMMNEIKRHYEQMEREREEEWKRREREDEERREEKRRRWEKMIKDLKQHQEEEMWRREREERERIERAEQECEEMKQKHEEETKTMKKKHQDEAKHQQQELNDFRKRKEQHIQELKERLGEIQNQLNKVKRLRKVIMEKNIFLGDF